MSRRTHNLELASRSLERKRAALIVMVAMAIVVMSAASAILSRTRHPTPLLVAVDEARLTSPVDILQVRTDTKETICEEPAAASVTVGARSNLPPRWPPLIALDFAHSNNETAPSPGEAQPPQPTFNGRPVRPLRAMTMLVTAYSPDERSCGESADGITASGYSVWTNGMKLVAADTTILPFGSLISVPGYDNGAVVPVLDRGGAIKGMRLDVLFPTHEQAVRWGVQELEVTVWEYADGLPNDFRENHRRIARAN